MIKFGKKLREIHKRLPLLANVLSRQKDIIAVYLFGSLAANAADELSDVDIALLVRGGPVSLEDELDLLGKITAVLGTDDVSLVILNNAPVAVGYSALKDAQVLYSSDDSDRYDFEEHVRKLYFDFKYYLDIYDREFISIVTQGKPH